MQSELKPCPFCGGEPHLMPCVAATYMIQCLQCKATTDDGSLDRISANWNRRSALVDVPAVETVAWEVSFTVGSTLTRAVFGIRDGADEYADRYSKYSPAIKPLYSSPPLSREGEDSAEVERLMRPIVGIEHRTAQEVFDIMADRIRLATTRSGSATTQKGCAE